MERTLIKIDRNGSKHYKVKVTCDRCNGHGYYAVGVHNGELVISPFYNGICLKCHGAGKVWGTEIERTPEYQAKLDARREAKAAKIRAELEAKEAERKAREAEEEAKRKAEEERIRAEKAISRYVGETGERITFEAVYEHSAWFEVPGPFGSPETRYVHNFRDEAGNKLIWKTGRGLGFDNGTKVKVRGTVKEHKEYREEKQTILTRCKVEQA